MTQSRKTGRYFEKKVQRLIKDNYPAISDADLAALSARFVGAAKFIEDTWHGLSVADFRYYTYDLLYPSESEHPDTQKFMTGYCREHGLLHRYPRGLFISTVETERDAAIAQVRQVDPDIAMTYELQDMLFNRFQGILAFTLHKHQEQIGHARQAYRQQERIVLSEVYEDLPLEDKIDFYLCGRKTPHDTAEAAATTLRSLPANHKDAETLTVYHCQWCDGYHLGHSYKHNDYTRADWRALKVHADFTWYHHFKKAKKYVERKGLTLDVKFTADEVEPLIAPDRPKIFFGG